MGPTSQCNITRLLKRQANCYLENKQHSPTIMNRTQQEIS